MWWRLCRRFLVFNDIFGSSCLPAYIFCLFTSAYRHSCGFHAWRHFIFSVYLTVFSDNPSLIHVYLPFFHKSDDVSGSCFQRTRSPASGCGRWRLLRRRPARHTSSTPRPGTRPGTRCTCRRRRSEHPAPSRRRRPVDRKRLNPPAGTDSVSETVGIGWRRRLGLRHQHRAVSCLVPCSHVRIDGYCGMVLRRWWLQWWHWV